MGTQTLIFWTRIPIRSVFILIIYLEAFLTSFSRFTVLLNITILTTMGAQQIVEHKDILAMMIIRGIDICSSYTLYRILHLISQIGQDFRGYGPFKYFEALFLTQTRSLFRQIFLSRESARSFLNFLTFLQVLVRDYQISPFLQIYI